MVGDGRFDPGGCIVDGLFLDDAWCRVLYCLVDGGGIDPGWFDPGWRIVDDLILNGGWWTVWSWMVFCGS